jgi:hypothetical protein
MVIFLAIQFCNASFIYQKIFLYKRKDEIQCLLLGSGFHLFPDGTKPPNPFELSSALIHVTNIQFEQALSTVRIVKYWLARKRRSSNDAFIQCLTLYSIDFFKFSLPPSIDKALSFLLDSSFLRTDDEVYW